jgi:hypothetical protein
VKIHRSLRLFAIIAFVFPGSVEAHDGPPFALLVDKSVGPCIVSVWADPDIGTGTFFVILSAPSGGTVPGDVRVTVSVQPVSGRLPEVNYVATRQALRDQIEFKTEAQFDVQELWRVRVKLESAQGTGEITTQVEPTPPGPGRWGILLYLFPFLVVGALWVRALLYRRSKSRTSV